VQKYETVRQDAKDETLCQDAKYETLNWFVSYVGAYEIRVKSTLTFSLQSEIVGIQTHLA
jgi:hypothetical protein